jgi:nucleoside phosphorylase
VGITRRRSRPSVRTRPRHLRRHWSYYLVPILTEYRAAARQIKRAEYAAEAVALFRPRGTSGVLSSRAPISIMLYLADHDGRLIRQEQGGLAVLEPPLDGWPPQAEPIRVRLLRVVDRRWELLSFGIPLAALLLASFISAVLHSAFVAVALAFLGLVWTASYIQVVFLRIVARMFRYPLEISGGTVNAIMGDRWHVGIAHQQKPELCDDLVRKIAERVRDLLETATKDTPLKSSKITELVMPTRSATTRALRDSFARSAGIVYEARGDQSIVALAPGWAPKPRATRRDGSFVALYIGSAIVTLLANAVIVASSERTACADTTPCFNRPTSFTSALSWLTYNLVWHDPGAKVEDLTRLLGWLVRLLGIVTMAVLVVGTNRYFVARSSRRRRPQEHSSAVTVVLLVATSRERDAVVAVARQTYGCEPALFSVAVGLTGLDLGIVENARVLLFMTIRGVPDGPSESVRILTSTHPDYLILTGVCVGLKQNGRDVGDVIVSQRLIDVETLPIASDQGGQLAGRTERASPSSLMLDRLLRVSSPDLSASIHYGTVLSTSRPISSRAEIERLRIAYPRAVGFEMESAGLLVAASARRTEWISIKGVAGFADSEFKDSAYDDAARNAAKVVLRLIMAGGLTGSWYPAAERL